MPAWMKNQGPGGPSSSQSQGSADQQYVPPQSYDGDASSTTTSAPPTGGPYAAADPSSSTASSYSGAYGDSHGTDRGAGYRRDSSSRDYRDDHGDRSRDYSREKAPIHDRGSSYSGRDHNGYSNSQGSSSADNNNSSSKINSSRGYDDHGHSHRSINQDSSSSYGRYDDAKHASDHATASRDISYNPSNHNNGYGDGSQNQTHNAYSTPSHDQQHHQQQQQQTTQPVYPVDRPGTRVGRWTAQVDPNSQSIFYWDPVSRRSQWERPKQPAPPPPAHELRPLPSSEWIEVLDEATGRFYLWNEVTDAVAWRLEDIDSSYNRGHA